MDGEFQHVEVKDASDAQADNIDQNTDLRQVMKDTEGNLKLLSQLNNDTFDTFCEELQLIWLPKLKPSILEITQSINDNNNKDKTSNTIDDDSSGQIATLGTSLIMTSQNDGSGTSSNELPPNIPEISRLNSTIEKLEIQMKQQQKKFDIKQEKMQRFVDGLETSEMMAKLDKMEQTRKNQQLSSKVKELTNQVNGLQRKLSKRESFVNELETLEIMHEIAQKTEKEKNHALEKQVEKLNSQLKTHQRRSTAKQEKLQEFVSQLEISEIMAKLDKKNIQEKNKELEQIVEKLQKENQLLRSHGHGDGGIDMNINSNNSNKISGGATEFDRDKQRENNAIHVLRNTLLELNKFRLSMDTYDENELKKMMIESNKN